MKNYRYPAIFAKEDKYYNVSFPNIDEAVTFAETIDEACEMAKECLELALDGREKIPEATDIDKLKLKKNEFVVLIEANMVEYYKKRDNKTVNKTVTLPKWLNDLGKARNINFSQVLQSALKQMLGV